jgi:tRNA-Thr(GGU) m(6)t(6)A37 methyltransferase TsaA
MADQVSDADNELRTGEVAVALPPQPDAGVYFIGVIHTPWKTRAECPKRGSPDGPVCSIVVDECWRLALTGLADHPRIQVLYWMHRSRRDLVLQTPHRVGRTFGTFALRSPMRPNPIASSVVELVAIEGTTLQVRGLDCIDGTPLIDLKPETAVRSVPQTNPTVDATSPQSDADGGNHAAPPPASLPALFDAALQDHQAGRLAEAEQGYRQVLAALPSHSDTLHLLGVVAHQSGRDQLAVDMIGRAIAINANNAAYHSNLGAALFALGRPDDAVASYRRALALNPDYPEAYRNQGTALRRLDRREEALACFRAALERRPDYLEALNDQGAVLAELGRLDEASFCFRRAVALAPDYPDAHNNLGSMLSQLWRLDEAAACFRRALALHPDYPEAQNNLGNVLKEQGRWDEAIECYRGALAVNPDYPEALNNLGSMLKQQGRLDEAVVCYRRALQLRPDFADPHNNLANALAAQLQFDEAIACYRRALALKPDFADAHNNLGMILLGRGDMAAGWEEYEWRWQTPQLRKARRDFAQPQWRGEAASGRTLLIHAEQGFGDTLQFCRYAALAAARGLRVILEVQQPLVRLLRSLAGPELVVGRGDPLPAFDLHCPMMSLPLAMGTSVASIPGDGPYLSADAVQAAQWRARLEAAPGGDRRVGLVWAGNPRRHSPEVSAVDRRRSIDPALLAPLFQVPGLRFFSLQKDGPPAPAQFALTDVMAEMSDFADTAALIANLDLVISVDTSVVHLAAALGKPVWMLDRFDPCWRWLSGRRDSPWYPTLRLYRQLRAGDWDSVVAEVARDLRGFGGR